MKFANLPYGVKRDFLASFLEKLLRAENSYGICNLPPVFPLISFFIFVIIKEFSQKVEL